MSKEISINLKQHKSKVTHYKMNELIESIFESSNPDDLLEPFIISDLKSYTKYDPFDSQHEVKILLSYYKDIISYSKSTLCLTSPKQFEFFKLGNELILSGTIKKPRHLLQTLISSIQSLNSIFNSSDLNSILTYFSHNYFQNIRLYNFIFSSRENTETTHIQALIDEPLPTIPLHKSVQRVKNRLPIEEVPDLRPSQPSRTRILNIKRNNESKEHLIENQNKDSEEEIEEIDPLENTVQKLTGEIDAEILKHEVNIDLEIDELRKRYR